MHLSIMELHLSLMTNYKTHRRCVLIRKDTSLNAISVAKCPEISPNNKFILPLQVSSRIVSIWGTKRPQMRPNSSGQWWFWTQLSSSLESTCVWCPTLRTRCRRKKKWRSGVSGVSKCLSQISISRWIPTPVIVDIARSLLDKRHRAKILLMGYMRL